MSIVARRGSSGSGWTWSSPPSGPRRPPPTPPLLALGGAGLIAVVVALVLLGFWLSGDDNSPADTDGTPTPTPAVATTPTPTVTATPAPTVTTTLIPAVSATPSPTATPSPAAGNQGPLFRLAVWDGDRWRFRKTLEGATYREGEAVPFLLRIDEAKIGDAYSLTITYDCQDFDLLTDYDRDQGTRPALASYGPENAIADTTVPLPHEPGTGTDGGEPGSLDLWGGSFTGIDGPAPSSDCRGEKSFTVELAAAADALYLAWAAEISPGAAEGDAPLLLEVQAEGAEELSIEIDPERLRQAPP